ncbi:MAG: UvrD-helicase domain-containing protein [Myxococcota bacterium]|nr:UvrD-helicase domain-containing protein [Myxococcota bacterium]
MSDSNFAPLDRPAQELAELGRLAERAFAQDPRAAMSHLRLFGERMALALLDVYRLPIYAESQVDRLRRLRQQTSMGPRVLDQLHTLRQEGNKAVHAYGRVSHSEAMRMLRAAHALTRWYWKEHTAKQPPKPGEFIKPTASGDRRQAAILKAQLDAERVQRKRQHEQVQDLLRMLDMPQVAFFAGVRDCFQGLDEDTQAQMEVFLKLFREEPLHEDWPLETPQGMADPKVRFVRQHGLVVTVVESPRGELLVVAHLGTQEQATEWANGRRFQVHPITGTLQVFDVQEAEQAAPQSAKGSLLQSFDDTSLTSLGLPAALLPAVRSLDTVAELDGLAPHLPPEASDALYLLAAGYTLEETRAELQGAPPEAETAEPVEIDEQDFAAAVHHPDSQRSFKLPEDSGDLEAVLSGSVEAWRLYLHPDQQKLVRMNANGPVRVLGGAGTGKTVALMHRTKVLLEERFVRQERVLVTTYTRNLASDLEHHLRQLLEPADLARLEVVNFHALSARLWAEHGNGKSIARQRHQDQAWETAMTHESLGLPISFYQDEFAQILLGQDITQERAYLKARRTGRGVPLGRAQRRQAWTVFEAYRRDLDDHAQIEHGDALRILRERYESGEIQGPFAAALADEVQDFGAPELRFLRAFIPAGPDDVFLVGDAHQRIYGSPVRMGKCGIEIRGRSRRLKVNYRTTAQVKDWAVAALEGLEVDDMDGGQDTLRGYHSLRTGPAPRVLMHGNREQELAAIRDQVRRWIQQDAPEHVCVAARTNKLAKDIAEDLVASEIPCVVLETDASASGEGVRIATFHRLKGLEFPRVLLAGVESGLMPLRIRGFSTMDQDSKTRWDQRERCLLYVAATRARDELVVTGSGATSEFLGEGS